MPRKSADKKWIEVVFDDDNSKRIISDPEELQKNKKKLKEWPSIGDALEAYWSGGRGF